MKAITALVLGAPALLSACGGSSEREPQVDIRVFVGCGGSSIYDPRPRLASGAPMECGIRVVNVGPDPATDVRVTLSPDAGAGIATTTCQGLGQAQCAGVEGLTIRIAALPADPINFASVAEIGFQASTPVGQNAEFKLTAQAISSGERNVADNTATSGVQLVTADVALSGRSLGLDPEGRPIFELRLENKGPGRADTALEFAALPTGFERLLLSCQLVDGSTCPSPAPQYPGPTISSGSAVIYRYALNGPVGWNTPLDLNISSPPSWNGDLLPIDNAISLRITPTPP